MLNRAALRLAPRPSGSIARRRRLEGWQCRQDGTAGTLRRCRWTHRSWRCSSWARLAGAHGANGVQYTFYSNLHANQIWGSSPFFVRAWTRAAGWLGGV